MIRLEFAPLFSQVFSTVDSPSLLSTALVERLGWVLVHSLWQFALVAVLAAIVVRLLRQRSAEMRHGVLVAALGLAVAAPCATWLRLSALILTGVNGFDVKIVYTLDPTESPKQIDLTPLAGPHKGRTFLGVYGLKGDDLWIALSDLGAVEKRPTDFNLAPGRFLLNLEPVDRPAPEKYQSATYLQKKLSAKVPDALWGKTRDGLRMAVVGRDVGNTEWNDLPGDTEVPSSLTVRPGEQVRCQLLVENVSDQDINLTGYSYTEVGRTVEVFDRQADEVPISTIHLSIPAFSTCWKLKPGERYLMQMPPLQFVAKHPEQGIGYFAVTQPGEHTLRIGYTFGDLTKDAIEPVQNKDEWTGKVTAAIKVNVVGPEVEAVKPANPEPPAAADIQPDASQNDRDQVAKIVQPLLPTVVTIIKGVPGQAAPRPTWRRSGVVIHPDGLILTTFAPADFGAGQLVVRLSDRSEHAAQVVVSDAKLGMAVLRIAPWRRLAAVSLGAAREVHEGNTIFAVPSPALSTPLQGNVTALRRDLGEGFPKNLIQSDVQIPLGEGGGLMVNHSGEPVGLWYAVRAGKQLVSYAIPLIDAQVLVAKAMAAVDADGAIRNELVLNFVVERNPDETIKEGFPSCCMESG